MIEEEEIQSLKRKNQQADNIMLARHHDGAYEGSQLLDDGDDDVDLRKTPIKPKQRFALLDSDEEGAASSKKKLLNDFIQILIVKIY